METFKKPREFVNDPHYNRSRERITSAFNPTRIDSPIHDIIAGFAKLPYCFTLQSCYGHFVYDAQPEIENTVALPDEDVGPIRYRIAYVAFCIELSSDGARFRGLLEAVPKIDAE